MLHSEQSRLVEALFFVADENKHFYVFLPGVRSREVKHKLTYLVLSQ